MAVATSAVRKPAVAKSTGARRDARVDAGIEALSLWLDDLVRQGLGTLEEGSATWSDMARRLEDAQCRGLARRVRRLPEIGAPDRLLHRLGGLALIASAWRRRDRLPAPLLADLRGVIGFEQRKEHALGNPPWVADRWLVLGQRDEGDDDLAARRTWLFGLESGRDALILQFAPKDEPFAWSTEAGQAHALTLAFWPSAWPLRAMIVPSDGASPPGGAHAPDRPPGYDAIEGLLDRYATVLAARPWVGRVAAVLREVSAFAPAANRGLGRPDPSRGRGDLRPGDVLVADPTGACLPLTAADPWPLLALSGGAPLDLAVEWDGEALRPLAAWVEGACWPLA